MCVSMRPYLSFSFSKDPKLHLFKFLTEKGCPIIAALLLSFGPKGPRECTLRT